MSTKRVLRQMQRRIARYLGSGRNDVVVGQHHDVATVAAPSQALEAAPDENVLRGSSSVGTRNHGCRWTEKRCPPPRSANTPNGTSTRHAAAVARGTRQSRVRDHCETSIRRHRLHGRATQTNELEKPHGEAKEEVEVRKVLR